MKRRLFNLAAAVSLVLCVATAALWVRSYFASDRIIWRNEQVDQRDGLLWTFSETGFTSSGGWLSYRYYLPEGQPDTWGAPLHERLARSVRLRNVHWERTATALPMQFWATRFGVEIPLPYWSLATILAIYPVRRVWTMWLRQQRGSKVGLCPTCGYDLRATPDRCPECGAEAAQAASR